MTEEELRRLEKGQKIMANIDGFKEMITEAKAVISEKESIARGELYIRGASGLKLYLNPDITISVLNTICTKSEEEIKRLQKEFDAL